MKIPEYDSVSSLSSSDLFIVETQSGTKKVSEDVLKSAVNSGMQTELTFDSVPTQNSSNPVRSGGIYSALDGKVNKDGNKVLSDNNFTNEAKTKLAGLENYDDTEVRGLIADKQDEITGGTTGQVLKKASNDDGDFEWGDSSGSGVPAGGTTGQVLRKHSNVDEDVEWSNIPEVPSGGAAGQVLTKKTSADGDFEWQTPAGSGDMLKSVYDTDNDGKVDHAEDADTVSGFTVSVSVPADAEFTDTVYDDTELRTLINGKVSTESVGAANGVASLDANGKVPASELPAYVDDVVNGYYNNVTDKFYEDASFTTEIAAETGKIYVDLYSNKTYRWSGSVYIEISESLALGETSSTAYAGNKGKANADAIQAIKDGTNIDSFSDVETALSSKADSADIPTATSDLTNDSNFIVDQDYVHTDNNFTTSEKSKLNGIEAGAEVNDISSISVNGVAVTPDQFKNVALTIMTNAVNDLLNYYLKSETYTKTEVNSLISAVSTINIEAVSSLPTTDISTTTIYLVPSADPEAGNAKDEYINLDGTTSGWELIGSTAIDLTGYVTDSDLNTALASYTTTADLTILLSAKQPKTLDTPIVIEGTTYTTVESLLSALAAGAGSGGAIPAGTSGQILRFDSNDTLVSENVATAATENNPALISSGAVYSAINNAIGAALSASY